MHGSAKMGQYEIWIHLCLRIYSYIEKLTIGLIKDDTFMPNVQSRHLDKGTKSTQ